MFTKQHYWAMAELVRATGISERNQLGAELADMFKRDNELFDRDAFLRACRLTTPMQHGPAPGTERKPIGELFNIAVEDRAELETGEDVACLLNTGDGGQCWMKLGPVRDVSRDGTIVIVERDEGDFEWMVASDWLAAWDASPTPEPLDFGARYAVDGHDGVAWRLVSHPMAERECAGHEAHENDEHAGIGEVLYCDGTCVEPELDEERVIAVMVGDDRGHVVDVSDLTKLDDNQFCSECGQIGCGHGRSEG